MSWKDWLPWNWWRKEREVPVEVRKEGDGGAALPARRDDPAELLRLFERRVLDDFFSWTPASILHGGGLSAMMEIPRLDVRETPEKIVVTAELPGVDEKDVSVTLRDRVLTIEGRVDEEKEERKGDCIIRERRYGDLRRSVMLPPGIDEEGVKAVFRNGLLEIELPRSAAGGARRIEVKRAQP